MRKLLLGVGLAFAVAGAAQAADYVVVASSDPGLHPGMEVQAGQHLALAGGRTVTLIAAAGDVTRLSGGPSGAVVPALKGGNGARLGQLQALVSPPPQGHAFGAARGGVCPEASSLTSLDDILAAQSGGCHQQAKAAFDAYVASHQQP